MDHRPAPNTIREDWIQRQQAHGKQPRAVLMKGLHPLINDTIDRWHKAVMAVVFDSDAAALPGTEPVLDLGCGYGRLAGQAKACGLPAVVGIDFTQKFCVDFELGHGPAVCGELTRLPFRAGSFRHAYSVTALMYLSVADARRALLELDRCLVPGSRILVLEPCREFNDLVRSVLRRKRDETLAMPGFTQAQLRDEIAPHAWRRIGAGSCGWMTLALPLLVASARWPALYARISRLALKLDRPRLDGRAPTGKHSMYRWIAYQKPD